MRIRNSINILLFFLGLGILVLIVVWAGPSKIWNASKRANLIFMVPAVLIFALYLFVRSLRWHTMLKKVKDDVKVKKFTPIYFINFMVSNITPGRSGEAFAPFLMKRYVGSSTGVGFSIVLVDRILDILFIVGMATLGFVYYIFFTELPHSINVVFYTAIGALVAVTGMMIIVVFWRKGAFAFLTAFTNHFFRSRQQQLLEGLSSFYDGIKTIRKVMPRLIGYVLLSWFLLAISYFLRVRAVMDAPFLPVASCWIISMCIGMASFIPSGLGSTQASFAVLLAIIMDSDPPYLAHATAAAILAKFVALFVIFALGLGSLFLLRRGKANVDINLRTD